MPRSRKSADEAPRRKKGKKVEKLISKESAKKQLKQLKLKKDPLEPKRGLSAYMFFSKQRRSSIVAEQKNLKAPDIAKILGQEWKRMTDEEKQPFFARAEEDKKRYQEAMKDYTPSEEYLALKAKQKSRKKRLEKVTDPHRPKRPKSAYMFFCASKRDDIRDQHPTAKNTDVLKLCGEAWRNLPDQDRRIYEEHAARDKLRYQDEMASYDPPELMYRLITVKKSKRDPNAPKKPKTAFFCFCDERRPLVKASLPDAKLPAIAKRLGELWRELAPTEKGKYEAIAAKDRNRYERQMQNYQPPPPESDDSDLDNFSENGGKKPKKDPNRPKAPSSAYIFFTKERRKDIKQERPDAKPQEILKMLGQEWKSMSDVQKAPYAHKQKEDKMRYEREIKSYKPPKGYPPIKRKKKKPAAKRRVRRKSTPKKRVSKKRRRHDSDSESDSDESDSDSGASGSEEDSDDYSSSDESSSDEDSSASSA